MRIIGLTGGIGSGKTTVAERFAEHGAAIVDADRVSREVVEPGQPALAELGEAFEGVIAPDGSLDRAELARQAFATPEATQRLNAITHPRIRERTAQLFESARRAGVDLLVYDMPLLVENGEAASMDSVVVVDAPDEVRVRRLIESRGLGEEDARARIRAQIDRDTRLAAADHVLDNSGSREELLEQADRVWGLLAAGE